MVREKQATASLTAVRDFALDLWRVHPYRMAISLGLMTVVSVLQGTGIALLVPLLSFLGLSSPLSSASGRSDVITRALVSVFGFLHVPLTLATVLAVFLAMVIAENGLRYLETRLTRRFIGNYVLGLKVRAFDAYLRAVWPFWRDKHAGHVANVLTLEAYRALSALTELTVFMSECLLAAVLAAVGVSLSWRVAVLFALGGVFLAYVMRALGRRGFHHGTAISERNSALQRVVQEQLQALKLVKASAMETASVDAYRAAASALNETEIDGMLSPFRTAALATPLVAAILCVGLFVAIQYFHVSGAQVMVAIFAFYRISTRATVAQRAWEIMLLNAPAYALLKQEVAAADVARERRQLPAKPRADFTTAIEIRNVAYEHRPGIRALDGVSLTIPAGRMVAIVGRSGGGKTTILDVLLGLLVPTSGDVLVDGRDLRDLDLQSWREQIGYVGQETALFDDTIENNIRWANLAATEAEFLEVLRQAHLEQFVRDIPGGAQARLGDRGLLVSGGERQRIALARALIRRPRLLVLDEATSSLDAASERVVQDAIDQLRDRMTILVVAHRLSTVRKADAIYVLDGGRLVQQGSWEELVTMPGPFATMWELQSGTGRRERVVS